MPRRPETPRKPQPLWFTDSHGNRYLIAQIINERMVQVFPPTLTMHSQLKKIATWCKNAEAYMKEMSRLKSRAWKDTL